MSFLPQNFPNQIWGCDFILFPFSLTYSESSWTVDLREKFVFNFCFKKFQTPKAGRWLERQYLREVVRNWIPENICWLPFIRFIKILQFIYGLLMKNDFKIWPLYFNMLNYSYFLCGWEKLKWLYKITIVRKLLVVYTTM